MDTQGYKVNDNVFHQDNQSAMKLEINGRKSCGQKSRHINIQYFFIKDRTEQENIKIKYCPTEEMLADFFTKPLQENLFRKFREVLMGRKHIDSLKKASPIAPSQERVGKGVVEKIAKVRTNDGSKLDLAEGKKNLLPMTKIPEQRSYASVVRQER